MDKFKGVVKEIKLKFPDFVIDEDIEDLPTVIFGFLCDYLMSSLIKDDKEIIRKFIDFIDSLSDDSDFIISACLDEIFLGLYTTKEVDYKKFKENLSLRAQNMFQETIDLWAAGNQSTTVGAN